MKKIAAPRKPREAAKPKAAKAARRKKAAKPAPKTPTPATAEGATSAPPPGQADDAPLSAAKERFAQAIALGAEQATAYRQANPGTRAKPETVWTEASKWASDPKVRQRIEELRAVARARANEAHLYSYEDAMREVDEALKVATFMLDSSAMSKAIDLKAKLSGLHVDPRANARDPFAGKTDAELLAEAAAAREELAKAGLAVH